MTDFGATYGRNYDRLYEGKDYEAECDLVESLLTQHGCPGARLVDIGCGTGGHAIPLARRGYSVVGVDRSPAMLAEAENKAAAHASPPDQPGFVKGDARDFALDQEFDAALMMFAVLGYQTTNDDVVAAMRNARRHLVAGGLFVCDFWYGPAVLSQQPGERLRVVDLTEGQLIRASRGTLDVLAHTTLVEFELWEIERERLVDHTREHHLMRFFFPNEVRLLLDLAGFELLHLGDFDQPAHAPTIDSWNAYFVARAV